MAAEQQTPASVPPPEAPAPPPSASLAATPSADRVPPAPATPAQPSSEWRVTKLLEALMEEKYARDWFGAPVDPAALNIPEYFDVVKQPMDLGTVLARLRGNSHYQSELDAVGDIRLTFSNAMLFNPPDNYVHVVAKRLLRTFENMLAGKATASKRAGGARGIASGRGASKKRPRVDGGSTGDSASVGESGPAAAAAAAAPSPSAAEANAAAAGGANGSAEAAKKPRMPPEQEEECARVLKAIMEHDCAGPFLEPVDPHALEIPDYHVLVPRPMDLGTVKRQLAKHHYSTVQEFADDVRLIWVNCVNFNGKDKGVSRMARQLSQKFERLMQWHPGLTPPPQL